MRELDRFVKFKSWNVVKFKSWNVAEEIWILSYLEYQVSNLSNYFLRFIQLVFLLINTQLVSFPTNQYALPTLWLLRNEIKLTNYICLIWRSPRALLFENAFCVVILPVFPLMVLNAFLSCRVRGASVSSESKYFYCSISGLTNSIS